MNLVLFEPVIRICMLWCKNNDVMECKDQENSMEHGRRESEIGESGGGRDDERVTSRERDGESSGKSASRGVSSGISLSRRTPCFRGRSRLLDGSNSPAAAICTYNPHSTRM